jgi:hypothetical protein
MLLAIDLSIKELLKKPPTRLGLIVILFLANSDLVTLNELPSLN